jgi:hypothetical protein
MAVVSTSVQPQQASQASIRPAQLVDLGEQLVMCATWVRVHSIIVAAGTIQLANPTGPADARLSSASAPD